MRTGISRFKVISVTGIVLIASTLGLVSCIPDRNTTPVASFQVSERRQFPDRWEVEFDASASFDPSGSDPTSNDPSGGIIAYTWDFGDGTAHVTTPEATVEHLFPAEGGTFVVTLTITDNDLVQSDPLSIPVNLKRNSPPIARFSVSGIEVTGAIIIATFDASDSSDPDGDDETALEYEWDFGDGERTPDCPELDTTRVRGRSVKNPIIEHRYRNRGTFVVQLVVGDGDARSAADIDVVEVP